jgi:O-acetyl-ADP-ribose deacetylase (regulator of RNase III)
MADVRLTLVRGDITKLAVDAIVNAANTTLLGGGGVDGAIHRAAGPELLAECKTLGGCRPGEAKITRGYALPARFVIHTVGPIWSGGHRGEPETLANCYRNSLRLTLENGVRTVAFPAISCGAYRYPIPDAARIAVETTTEFLHGNDSIVEVTFVVSSDDIYSAYQRLLS